MMNPINVIAVQMSELEAARFVQFQKHYEIIKRLEEVGAFDLKLGSVTLNFDQFGKIGSIEKKELIRY